MSETPKKVDRPPLMQSVLAVVVVIFFGSFAARFGWEFAGRLLR